MRVALITTQDDRYAQRIEKLEEECRRLEQRVAALKNAQAEEMERVLQEISTPTILAEIERRIDED